jgi:type IV secretion system protein VirD4
MAVVNKLLKVVGKEQAAEFEYRPAFERLKTEGGAWFASDADCRKSGLSGGKGIVCGYSPQSKFPLRWDGDAMITTIAPVGSGKDTDLVAPNIFSLDDRSLCIFDPKGESAAVTAAYRAKLGPVYILNPYAVLLEHMKGRNIRQARYNPLARLEKLSELERGAWAAKLADGIVWKSSFGADQFFDRSSDLGVQGVCTALAAHGKPEEKNLGRLADIISGPELYDFARMIQRVSSDPFTLARLSRFAPEGVEDNKTVSSIKESMATEVAFLTEPAIRECLSGSDFSFSEMRERIMTVYVVIPLDKLDIAKKFLRLIMSCFLCECLQPGRRKVRVTAIMNEFYQYGAMESVANAYGMARGFGVQLWALLQDLSQLVERYPQSWQTFLSNSGLRMFMTPQDQLTADYIADQSGTMHVSSWSKSIGVEELPRMFFFQKPKFRLHATFGTQIDKRPLIEPHEARALRQDRMFVWVRELGNVIVAHRKPYFKTFGMKDKARPNPYYKPKSLW